MGDEAALGAVMSHDVVAWTVRQAEARREAMIAKWDHNGWLEERAVALAFSVGPDYVAVGT